MDPGKPAVTGRQPRRDQIAGMALPRATVSPNRPAAVDGEAVAGGCFLSRRGPVWRMLAEARMFPRPGSAGTKHKLQAIGRGSGCPAGAIVRFAISPNCEIVGV